MNFGKKLVVDGEGTIGIYTLRATAELEAAGEAKEDRSESGQKAPTQAHDGALKEIQGNRASDGCHYAGNRTTQYPRARSAR